MKNPTRHFIGVHLERAVIAFFILAARSPAGGVSR
jgi:hypothetical protein